MADSAASVRRRNLIVAVVLGLVAIGFYVGFVLSIAFR